jgi:CDP-2,3-bis-(O-geranylgeranyl)-sn-glycerol synthase
MPPIQGFVNFPALLLLMVANSAPVVATWGSRARWSAPIDGNRMLPDGRPFFGSHKTWRGLIAGLLAAGLVGQLLAVGFGLGALFGVLTLAGDLLSSFIKRRLAHRSGKSVLLLDQLPEALLPMLLLRRALGLDAMTIFGTALLFTALDLLTARFRP